eukprot:6045628-Alexandrium_andersonii.AAC.1
MAPLQQGSAQRARGVASKFLQAALRGVESAATPLRGIARRSAAAGQPTQALTAAASLSFLRMPSQVAVARLIPDSHPVS